MNFSYVKCWQKSSQCLLCLNRVASPRERSFVLITTPGYIIFIFFAVSSAEDDIPGYIRLSKYFNILFLLSKSIFDICESVIPEIFNEEAIAEKPSHSCKLAYLNKLSLIPCNVCSSKSTFSFLFISFSVATSQQKPPHKGLLSCFCLSRVLFNSSLNSCKSSALTSSLKSKSNSACFSGSSIASSCIFKLSGLNFIFLF